MNVLMTGATGMVGKALAQELMSRGHRVSALTREKFPLLPEGVSSHQWNGHSPPPAVALNDVDAVFHLAGENIAAERWSQQRKHALYDSRIATARYLAEGLERAGRKLEVFISASAIGIFGDRGADYLTDEAPAGGDFLARLCVDWEAVADRMPARRIVKTRFGIILSKEGGFLGKVVPMFKKLGASRLGSGKQYVSWIHLTDVVRTLVRALEDFEMAGAYNTCSPNPVTNSDLTEALKRRLNAWPGPPAPKFALRLLYGEMADALLFSQRAMPKRLRDSGFEFKFGNLEKALAEVLPAPARK